MISKTVSKVSLLTESYPRYGFDALSILVRMGWDALCITRLHPGYITQKFNLEGVRCLWLSSRKGKNVLSPKSLGPMVKAVKAAVREGGNTTIFLDGLEYILMWNNVGKAIAALNEINAFLENRRAEMLVCIDPLTLEQKDLDRLWMEYPRYSATEIVEILSTGLPQQISGALPETADRTIGDLLGPGELHAVP